MHLLNIFIGFIVVWFSIFIYYYLYKIATKCNYNTSKIMKWLIGGVLTVNSLFALLGLVYSICGVCYNIISPNIFFILLLLIMITSVINILLLVVLIFVVQSFDCEFIKNTFIHKIMLGLQIIFIPIILLVLIICSPYLYYFVKYHK